MNAVVLILCVLGADPSLVLTVGSEELLQCDHLVVKTVLRNDTELSVTIDRRGGFTDDSIRIESKLGGKWKSLGYMDEQFGVPAIGGVPDPILESGAVYAQYDVLMFTGKTLDFEKPGTYELRAAVSCSGNSIVSPTVKVVVKERDADSLERIKRSFRGVPFEIAPGMTPEEIKRRIILSHGDGKFGNLGATWFQGEVGEGLEELADVGGNLGAGIQRLQLLSRILEGIEPTGEDVIGYIRARMNKVDAEVALHVLGRRYEKKRDWDNLAKVVGALPDKSMMVYQWAGAVERARPTVPRVVVPTDANK